MLVLYCFHFSWLLTFLFLIVCSKFCCIFFFKQKTAYELRISDWSSDVCSSDLFVATNGMAVSTDGIRTLPRLLGSQARASAPDAHVWLSASAGTRQEERRGGKEWVGKGRTRGSP